MVEIIWKQGAEEDLLGVFAAKEDFREGVGEQFVMSLEVTLQNLRQYPEMAPVFVSPMRRLVVGTSGFGLFYTVEKRGIIIHALVHLNRNPETIREKVRRLLNLE